jgi:hypothetical protein
MSKSIKPLSPKSKGNAIAPSVLGKRKYGESFTHETFNDARYSQPIPEEFFQANMGHTVIQEQSTNNNNKSNKNESKQKEDFGPFIKRERDCESKYDIDEMREWCEYYIANKNLFNV